MARKLSWLAGHFIAGVATQRLPLDGPDNYSMDALTRRFAEAINSHWDSLAVPPGTTMCQFCLEDVDYMATSAEFLHTKNCVVRDARKLLELPTHE